MNKSPGEFYKKFKGKIAPILSEIYNIFTSEKNLLRRCKMVLLRLLYKKDDPSKLKNWRPISLLDLDYKILTKVLAIRLKDIMEKLLNPLQAVESKEEIY